VTEKEFTTWVVKSAAKCADEIDLPWNERHHYAGPIATAIEAVGRKRMTIEPVATVSVGG
jgi:hypothetical protein